MTHLLKKQGWTAFWIWNPHTGSLSVAFGQITTYGGTDQESLFVLALV